MRPRLELWDAACRACGCSAFKGSPRSAAPSRRSEENPALQSRGMCARRTVDSKAPWDKLRSITLSPSLLLYRTCGGCCSRIHNSWQPSRWSSPDRAHRLSVGRFHCAPRAHHAAALEGSLATSVRSSSDRCGVSALRFRSSHVVLFPLRARDLRPRAESASPLSLDVRVRFLSSPDRRIASPRSACRVGVKRFEPTQFREVGSTHRTGNRARRSAPCDDSPRSVSADRRLMVLNEFKVNLFSPPHRCRLIASLSASARETLVRTLSGGFFLILETRSGLRRRRDQRARRPRRGDQPEDDGSARRDAPCMSPTAARPCQPQP